MKYHDREIFVFGEVLFDIFDGERKLGGAPFNVAYNLHMQGLLPRFISRVGADELGSDILNFLKRNEMAANLVGVDDSLDTGQVIVSLNEGEPSYDIRRDVAYDHIECDGVDFADTFVYYGTLASRSEKSRNTLFNILNSKGVRTFYDVNLRNDNWSIGLVRELAHYADSIKLNIDELNIVAGAVCPNETTEGKCRGLMKAFDISEVYVTCGSEGALLVDRNGMILSEEYPVKHLKDTVGAGDAFSSVIIKAILSGQDRLTALNTAAYYAARICSLHGALTENKEFYSGIKEDIDAVFKK
ncbi:PfkB domain protein [Denitrovibrio acetiphilus DSM 12809]|uniref:PfkB domain protein n=1 Tax=Denitrovibrio acetiphilus (strain DSM 12809 / NBRC 114555 / N2460) TaxID=522772 RepID=D4H6L8_DENA2|nr:PfkB family carbohydrate kinase [Denitrovibrio acetiphilus]ADD69692.1 PfkB domain protein [Denitrovibrio acetiphilus DSM 12809]